MDIGVKPYDFWEYSIQELFELIESSLRIKEKEQNEKDIEVKLRVSLNFLLAKQIGEFVATLFSKDAKITPLHEVFPDLFEDEIRSNDEDDIALYKAKFENYAFQYNKNLEKKGGE